MQHINPKDFIEKLNTQKLTLIDVRQKDEFNNAHIPGSILIQLDDMRHRLNEIPKNEILYLICQSGNRSKIAQEKLADLGYQNTVCLTGGIKGFKEHGGKLNIISHALPLMQQVQITAGSLVVAGFILANTIHPYFIYLSLFVGCGLIFAGITGFCGMAILLSKMPWNKTGRKPCSS